MDLKLHVWRQASREDPGAFASYTARGISEHSSFLEMLDVVNENLTREGKEPIAFDHDCREGICGSCSMMINGEAKRDDAHFSYVAAWEFQGDGKPPAMHKESLTYESVHLAQRSYK